MTIRVLVVDDSSFFRRRVSEILNAAAGLEVVGTASDGAVAIEQTKALKPDVITMDIEMPVLDGISSVRRIMSECPTPILMFSSLTHEGAQATLDALEAGALDFLPKKFEDIARNRDEAVNVLQQRVSQIARKRVLRRSLSRPTPASRTAAPRRSGEPDRSAAQPLSRSTSRTDAAPVSTTNLQPNPRYKVVAIGTSTGGPVALQTVLTSLPANFPYPILLVQHMPAAFTRAFAQRLNGLCKIEVREASDGDMLQAGVAYLAPGGMQMLAEGRPGSVRLRIKADENERITYRPSVDITFASLSKVYGGDVLALILTGMGADGCEGARLLKSRGASIWAQDEESSVVYGMPQAVTTAGIAEKSLALKDVARCILREVGYH